MERASRRSAAQSHHHDASAAGNNNNNNNSSGLRRRRRDASAPAAKTTNTSASQSDDGAETDASSVATAPETGSTTRSGAKKLLPSRDAKKRSGAQRSENPAASDRSESRSRHGNDDEVDGDDEHDDDDEHGVSSSESHGAVDNNGDTGSKRERSLSNVSTTSSSASEHDEADEHALQQEKLLELEKKKKMVEDGTLAEFCRRVSEFKEERNRLLETAEWHKSLQLKNCQDLYDFEVQRAHNLWQQAKDAVKSEMLARIDALTLKLKRELQDVAAAQAREAAAAGAATSAPSSSPTSDTTEPEDAGAASEPEERSKLKAPSASKRRKIGPQQLLPESAVRLPLDDISADLASILGERTQCAEVSTARTDAGVTATVKSERRRLVCGKYTLEDGDEVVVSSPVIKEDYVGTISSVTDDAVYIKLASGQKVRVYLDLLVHRRCKLKPLLRTPVSGWTDVELI